MLNPANRYIEGRTNSRLITRLIKYSIMLIVLVARNPASQSTLRLSVGTALKRPIRSLFPLRLSVGTALHKPIRLIFSLRLSVGTALNRPIRSLFLCANIGSMFLAHLKHF
jgi:hypothetical protein